MGNKNISMNSIDLDELNQLGEEENDDYYSILHNTQTLCGILIDKTDAKLELVDDLESDEYYATLYENEVYVLIKDKFFKKTSISSFDRIENIKTFIKSRSVRLEKYLISINNVVVKGDLDAIEAVNKLLAFNKILNSINGIVDENDVLKEEFINFENTNSTSENIEDNDVSKDINETETETETKNKSISEQASILSKLLTKIDNNEDISIKEDKELSE